MFWSVFAFSQKNILKANLFSPVAKTGSLFYERALKKHQSFQIGASLTIPGGEIDGKMITCTPEYRFYLIDSIDLQGVYIAPYLRYYYFDETDPVNSLSVGINLGRQMIFRNRIGLEGFIGPSFGYFPYADRLGLGVRAGITMGIAF
jgi:hypothetical protein